MKQYFHKIKISPFVVTVYFYHNHTVLKRHCFEVPPYNHNGKNICCEVTLHPQISNIVCFEATLYPYHSNFTCLDVTLSLRKNIFLNYLLGTEISFAAWTRKGTNGRTAYGNLKLLNTTIEYTAGIEPITFFSWWLLKYVISMELVGYGRERGS